MPKPRILTYQGRSMSISDWAREKGIRVGTLRRRIDTLGLSIEQAFQIPVGTIENHQNHTEKMTTEEVVQLCITYRNHTQVDLAEKFNVNIHTVRKMIKKYC